MTFKKGDKKLINSGRKKGTPNKITANIRDRLMKEDIVGSLLNIAKATQKEEIKLAVYKELMKYCYPQLKSLDIGAAEDREIKVFINHEPVAVERD